MGKIDNISLFCSDPPAYYGQSLTKMQSQPREDYERLQLAALRLRFEQLRDAIPMVQKLADAEGVREINRVEDVIPLLFDHTMYKSYPPSFLHNNRFDQMTRWLNKLTTVDLSGFDASDCPTVDDWVVKLYERTPLNVVHTSGTTGLFSFLPRTKSNWDFFMRQYRVSVLQEFGKESPLAEYPLNIHAIYPYFRSGGGHLMLNDLYVKYICGGEERFHAAYPGRLSSNLLLLFSRMRAAAARGELDRFEISPDLMARRDEFVKLQETKDEHVAHFFDELSQKLRGERVFIQAVPAMLYQMAKTGLARGDRGLFARDSIIIAGGGAKGAVLPDNWDDYVKHYLGVDRVTQIFGMGEMITFFPLCEGGHYHVMPGILPFILDPETSKPLARQGRVTGRWAYYDLVSDAHWGGFISGDEVTMNWDAGCSCGRRTPYLEKSIRRYSEISKGGDKITCAATEAAYQEAMDFLIAADAR